MDMPRRVAVAIPTLNEAAGIADVIAAVLPEPSSNLDVRLYVADGGSSDATRPIVQSLARSDDRIRLLDNPKRLQSAAINLVARTVGDWADILIRCDAHAAYPPDFVPKICEAMARTDAASVVVPMDSVGRSATGRSIAWVSDTIMGSGGSAHRGGRRAGFVDHGHHAGWKLDRFAAIGGYDESFSHNEDAELDCRLRATGDRIWLAGDIRITYQVRSTLAALWRQYRAYGKGRSRTVKRHPGSVRARQLLVPIAMSVICCATVGGVVFRPLWLIPMLYATALAATSVAGVRRLGRDGWRAGPAAGVMHLSWAMGFVAGMASGSVRPSMPPREATA